MRSANSSPGRTSIRKTSLLRIVPTACGQAADIALSRFGISRIHIRSNLNSSMSHQRADVASAAPICIDEQPRIDDAPSPHCDFHRRAAWARSMLGDCDRSRRCRHDRIPERSFLFTMSNTRTRTKASRLDGGCERRFLCERATRLVEPDGIEPTTSCLQSRRSPN